MEHLFIQGQSQRTLVLLHGTGGDEYSLVEIGRQLDGKASLLGLRGAVQEAGANRYFRRFAEGQFDLVNLEEQGAKLVVELARLAKKYDLLVTEMVLVGYSNGANIGAHLLLEKELEINKGIFFHSMSLGESQNKQELTHKNVWLSFGEQDPIVPVATFNELVFKYQQRGATVTTCLLPISHGLVEAELLAAQKWLEEIS